MPNSAELKRAQETAANTTVIQGEGTADHDRPDYVNELCERQHADVAFIRDVYAGTKHLRKKGQAYLPKHSAEEDEDYNRRLLRATLFNGVRRTAKGLVGMIYARDPVTDEVTERIQPLLENIDLTGRALPIFARDVTLDSILDGHGAIVVEHPPKLKVTTASGEEREPTLADERAAKLRPYAVQVRKSDVINVQWEMVNGEPFLTLFVYREQATESVGRFGERTVERFRVLRPGSYEVWQQEQENGKLKWVLVEDGLTSLSYVPAIPAYADQVGVWESCPPLIDLAHENIDHYVNRNEHKMSLARARIPMPVFTNATEDGVKWGANYSIKLEGDGASAMMLESSGAALEESRMDIKDTETRMAALGLSMLVRETRAAETEGAKRIDKSESDSQLAVIARGIQDALDMMLWMMGDYMGIERESVGHIELNDDFADYEISPQMLRAMLDARAENRITNETLWTFMQKGKLLPEDFDAKDEAELLEMEDMPEPRDPNERIAA